LTSRKWLSTAAASSWIAPKRPGSERRRRRREVHLLGADHLGMERDRLELVGHLEHSEEELPLCLRVELVLQEGADAAADRGQRVRDPVPHELGVVEERAPVLGRSPARGLPDLAQHPLERRTQVGLAGGAGVVRIVREHLEEAAPEDLVALRHRRAEVGVADGGDRQLGGQDEI